MTQEPPLALFAWSASPDCAATNSNKAKDGTYASKREGQRGVGGTCLAEAGGAKKSGWEVDQESRVQCLAVGIRSALLRIDYCEHTNDFPAPTDR